MSWHCSSYGEHVHAERRQLAQVGAARKVDEGVQVALTLGVGVAVVGRERDERLLVVRCLSGSSLSWWDELDSSMVIWSLSWLFLMDIVWTSVKCWMLRARIGLRMY